MPRKYVRKVGARPRAIWTEDALKSAFEELRKKAFGINEISRRYGIPVRTLKRRFEKQNTEKLTLGKHPVLDFANEKRLSVHVQKLEKAGFPLTRNMIQSLAFDFADKLGIKTNFNKETRKAGPHWLRSFLERHPELSVRQAEGMSLARAQGLNRTEVKKMFDLLLEVMTEHDLLDKPDCIFNIDETGVQLNNSPGKVIATKGAKVVQSITSGEKGETMSIIACCNAVGNFVPPVVIIKGVNKKPEFQDGLPPGAEVYMNRKSAYVNAELFQKWLQKHFVPRKPQGKVLLILDGHASHTNSVNMLKTAGENEIILFCLPSHTTQALQPLDRSFFKPFKTFYAAETKNWIVLNKNRKINRLVAGKLIGKAWIRAATTSNAVSGFKACGIYPYNPAVIPENFFAISDMSLSNEDNQQPNESNKTLELEQLPSGEHASSSIPSCSNQTGERFLTPTLAQRQCSLPRSSDTLKELSPRTLERFLSNSPTVLSQPIREIEKQTPSKFLHECSPLPIIPVPLYKRGKQSAAVLTTKENISAKENTIKGKATPRLLCKNSKQCPLSEVQVTAKMSKKRTRVDSENSDTCASDEIDTRVCNIQKTKQNAKSSKISSVESQHDTGGYECVECFEDYQKTKSKVDWIQCIMCKKWLHESCTLYRDYCNLCHRAKLLQMKKKRIFLNKKL